MRGHGYEQEDVQHQLEREPAEPRPFLINIESHVVGGAHAQGCLPRGLHQGGRLLLQGGVAVAVRWGDGRGGLALLIAGRE